MQLLEHHPIRVQKWQHDQTTEFDTIHDQLRYHFSLSPKDPATVDTHYANIGVTLTVRADYEEGRVILDTEIYKAFDVRIDENETMTTDLFFEFVIQTHTEFQKLLDEMCFDTNLDGLYYDYPVKCEGYEKEIGAAIEKWEFMIRHLSFN